jgi:hypothetical protein
MSPKHPPSQLTENEDMLTVMVMAQLPILEQHTLQILPSYPSGLTSTKLRI